MNDKKILVLFSCHFINSFSLSQYNKLKNELPKGYDLYWWIDNICKDKKINEIKFIEFPHYTITSKPLSRTNFFNPTKYVETYFINNEWFRKYDFYWVVEYDVYFSGNWGVFFYTVDKYNEDLVGSSFLMYNDNAKIHSFRDGNTFDSFKFKIKSTLSIYRLSNRALKYISFYKKDSSLMDCNNIKNYLYEVYIPTLLYNKGYSLLGLNAEENKLELENENYRHDIDFVNFYEDTKFINDTINTFWWDVTFFNVEDMKCANKLYTRYKFH